MKLLVLVATFLLGFLATLSSVEATCYKVYKTQEARDAHRGTFRCFVKDDATDTYTMEETEGLREREAERSIKGKSKNSNGLVFTLTGGVKDRDWDYGVCYKFNIGADGGCTTSKCITRYCFKREFGQEDEAVIITEGWSYGDRT